MNIVEMHHRVERAFKREPVGKTEQLAQGSLNQFNQLYRLILEGADHKTLLQEARGYRLSIKATLNSAFHDAELLRAIKKTLNEEDNWNTPLSKP